LAQNQNGVLAAYLDAHIGHRGNFESVEMVKQLAHRCYQVPINHYFMGCREEKWEKKKSFI
jgi:hypothetical protein